MAERTIGIQDAFLAAIRREGIPVTIHIINGFTLKSARVKSFDNYAVLVECEGKQMMIYKHAISTLTAESEVKVDC